MDRDDPAEHRPAAARLVYDGLQLRHNVFVVGLVLERLNIVSPCRVISDGPGEGHERATRRRYGPGRRFSEWQRFMEQRHPVVAAWVLDHYLILQTRALAPF